MVPRERSCNSPIRLKKQKGRLMEPTLFDINLKNLNYAAVAAAIFFFNVSNMIGVAMNTEE